jgi:molecular chaperone Hsp33
VRLGVHRECEGKLIAGGIFLQHLPEGEEWVASGCTPGSIIPNGSMSRRSAATMGADELADAAIPLENLVWRLFNEEPEVRLLPGTDSSRAAAAATLRYITQVLGKFPAEERAAMADEEGVISVDCAFCSTKFPVQLADFVSPPL